MHCCTKLFRKSWDVERFISIPIYERETSQLVCYSNCIPFLHRLQVWNSSIHSLTKKRSRITCHSSTSKSFSSLGPHGIIGFHHPYSCRRFCGLCNHRVTAILCVKQERHQATGIHHSCRVDDHIKPPTNPGGWMMVVAHRNHVITSHCFFLMKMGWMWNDVYRSNNTMNSMKKISPKCK